MSPSFAKASQIKKMIIPTVLISYLALQPVLLQRLIAHCEQGCRQENNQKVVVSVSNSKTEAKKEPVKPVVIEQQKQVISEVKPTVQTVSSPVVPPTPTSEPVETTIPEVKPVIEHNDVDNEAKPTVDAAVCDVVTSESNLDLTTNSFLLKPASILKYLIGQKGATIKMIQEETNSKIDVTDKDDETKLVSIKALEGGSVEKTYERILEELKRFGWEYKKEEGQFIETGTESMKLFKELEKKISEQSKIMGESFQKSKEAFESGDKELASKLSEQGKEAQRLMKQYQTESANTMFETLNKERGELEIDLHGQYVDFAMKFLEERIEKLKQEQKDKLLIIYGAGNHSDENGPKIKPTVLEYLNKMSITYEEQTHGSIMANLL